jgi:cell wall-associated NlpC family hydrolase
VIRNSGPLNGLHDRTDESVTKNLTQLRVQARTEALLGRSHEATRTDAAESSQATNSRPGTGSRRGGDGPSPQGGRTARAGSALDGDRSATARSGASTSSRAGAPARIAGKVGDAASAGSRAAGATKTADKFANADGNDAIDSGHSVIGRVTSRTGQSVARKGAEAGAQAAGRATKRSAKIAHTGGRYLAGQAAKSLTAARDSRAALRTQTTSKAVRGGLVAQQRRKAAAKTATGAKTTVAKTGQSITTALPRAGAALSRAGSAVVAVVRAVVSAVIGAFSGTPVLLITVTVIGVLMAIIATIVWLIPGVQQEQQDQQQIGNTDLKPGAVPSPYVKWINQAGSLCPEITPPIIAAHIYAESSFKDHPANSAGAAGPAQFTAATWKTWGIDADHNGTKDLHSVPDAVVAMGRMDCGMLKSLSAKFPDATDPVGLALAAYLNGPAAVIAAHGIPADNATQSYVQTIESLASSRFGQPGDDGVTLPAGSLAAKAIAAAKAQLGTPYSFGGGTPQGPTVGATSPAGWDCSSYMQMAYYQASKGKINLPRVTYDQIDSSLVAEVSMSKIAPGDLTFVQTDGATWSHVVMYLGNGKIIEEPHTGAVSRIAPLSEYKGMTQAARRVKP